MSGGYQAEKAERELALLRSVYGVAGRDDEPRSISFDGGVRSQSYHLPSDPTLDRLLPAGWIPVDQE